MTVNTFSPPNAIATQLPTEFYLPEEAKMAFDFIIKRERLTADVVNAKQNSNFDTQEYLAGQLYFSTANPPTLNNPKQLRNVFRKVINFGALPNNATKSVAHGLTLDDGVNPSTYFFTNFYASAFDPTTGAEKGISFQATYYDIAAGAVANPINLNLDQTNVNITTTSNRTNFSRCYVVLEYIKNF